VQRILILYACGVKANHKRPDKFFLDKKTDQTLFEKNRFSIGTLETGIFRTLYGRRKMATLSLRQVKNSILLPKPSHFHGFTYLKHKFAYFSVACKMQNSIGREDDDFPRVFGPADVLMARQHLHQGVQSALGVVQVARNLGVPHIVREHNRVPRQRQVVSEAVRGTAGLALGAARIVEPRLVHERHQRLVHERAETQPEVSRHVCQGVG
jgi:hypothetical protein